jgi:uncharacterized membrane protein YidH (DUF202 family)
MTRPSGLQAERTALSWNRVGMLLVANAVLALRAGWVSGRPSYSVVGALLVLAAASAIAYGGVRRHQLLSAESRGLGPPTAPPVFAMVLTTAATALACIAGSVSALLEF